MANIAILTAGGTGTRTHQDLPKQFLTVENKPIIIYTLEAFQQHPSLFRIAHGHAAALCIKGIWPFMVKHTGNCIDARGEEYLKNTFDEIADAMGCSCVEEAIYKFKKMVDELELPIPENVTDKDYEILKNSVNPVRLKNNPVALSVEKMTTKGF